MRGTLTCQRYVDDILQPHVVPVLNGLPGAIFQQDNARSHYRGSLGTEKKNKAVTLKCLGSPSVDRDRRNAHLGFRTTRLIINTFRVVSVVILTPVWQQFH
ncbi:hypothetical protein TNCV_2602051 [Trichonephila clavipes]|nr:hypothetical protein TNCV_2602051 [Trichonephila clavipes]